MAAARTPLVNRQRELEELRRLWDLACAGQGQALLLSAEAGVGKSRLAADLVDAQGACAGASAATSEGEQGQLNARGVGLEMTECQVVQSLGAPEATDIARNERGERAVTMTYLRTERAGLYRFVRGRLVSIERAPGAAEPERPAKQPAKKPAKKPEPS